MSRAEVIKALRSDDSRSRFLATASSVLSAVCIVLLLPIILLYVDHLVWKGRIPSYGQLAPAKQTRFREYWNSNPSLVDRFKTAGQTDAETWETKWETATVDWLKNNISANAASLYISDESPNDIRRTHHLDETRLGILPTVVREQGRWTGRLTATIARVCPWTWQPGADGNANDAYLATLLIVAFLLASLAGLGALGARHYASDAAIGLTCRVRRALTQHASRLSTISRSPEAAAEASQLLTQKAADIGEAEERTLRSVWRNRVLMVGTAGLMLLIHPILAGAILAGGAAVWLIVGHVVAAARRDGRHAAKALQASEGRLRESVERQFLVKAYLMDRFAQNRVERQLDECAEAERRIRRGHAFSRPFMTIVGGVGAVVLLYALGTNVLAGGISIGGVAALVTAAAMFAWALRSQLHVRASAKVARAADADMAEFLERRTDPGQSLDAEFLQPISKRLEFQSVAIRESGSGKMLLEELTASIPAGSRVAIVGSDQESLKSIAQVLVGFIEPTAGDVKADGKNIRWVTTDSLRTQIAYVAEDSLTMTDTVANNIGCGDTSFGLPQVMEAAKVAHAHQFVQRLAYGYETLIGGPGSVLTVGQQFRIALARAILRDPSVLIVEDPRTILDADSAALVDDTFSRIRHGRTIIHLAHRESTLRAADTIFVVDQGKVVATGTHDSLMKNSDAYRRLGYWAAP